MESNHSALKTAIYEYNFPYTLTNICRVFGFPHPPKEELQFSSPFLSCVKCKDHLYYFFVTGPFIFVTFLFTSLPLASLVYSLGNNAFFVQVTTGFP